jgi:hypothetical protein
MTKSEWVWVIKPGGMDGHSHDVDNTVELQDFEKPKHESTEGVSPEETEASKCLKLYKFASSFEEKCFKKAVESEDFFMGKQWEDGQVDTLKNTDRAYLTLNYVQAHINTLSGYERQNRTRIAYLPMEGGDQRLADILSVLVKNICDQNAFDMRSSQVFLDGAVPGRGVYDISADYDYSPLGDIRIRRYPWQDIVFGPHEELDLSDLEHLHKTKWMSLSQIEANFPDQYDDIHDQMYGTKDDDQRKPLDKPNWYQRIFGKQYVIENNPTVPYVVSSDPDIVNIADKTVKVIETWRKEYYTAKFFTIKQDNFTVDASRWSEADINSAKTIPDFEFSEERGKRMRMTLYCGKVLINDEYADLPTPDFYVAAMYGVKRSDRWCGIVEWMKDPQREINKRRSQIVDLLNKVCGRGLFYTKNAFPNNTEKQKFIETGSKPGAFIEISDYSQKPQPFEDMRFPEEIARMSIETEGMMRQIINLPDLNSGSINSAKQLNEVRRTGLVGTEYLYDALDMAKRRVGKLLPGLIQSMYTPERITRVIQNVAMKDGVRIGNNIYHGEFDDVTKEELENLLRDADLTRYDVAIVLSPDNATIRQSSFQAWAQLKMGGMNVPDQLLIDLSDLPDKQMVMSQMAQVQQQAAQMEQGKQNTEIQKTLIAANAKRGATPQPQINPMGGM